MEPIGKWEGSLKKGQVVFADLDPVIGSEEGKIRPALIVQNDLGNRFSPTTIIVPITSVKYTKYYPTNVEIEEHYKKAHFSGTVLTNQIRVIDRKRILHSMGHVSIEIMQKVNNALKIGLGLS